MTTSNSIRIACQRNSVNSHEYTDVEFPSAKNVSTSEKIAIAIAELMGTAILVFVACMGGSRGVSGGYIAPFQSALASGLAVLIVIHIFGHISCAHVNPVTTVCAYAMGAISSVLIPIYMVAQLIGAALGFGLVIVVTPEKHLYPIDIVNGTVVKSPHGIGMTLPPQEEVSVAQALMVEILITLILSFANCAAFDKRTAEMTDSLSIRFGLMVSTLNFIAVPYSGASMNPARSFGPAIWYNDWHNHWIYWVGPMLASAMASAIYRLCFARKLNANYNISVIQNSDSIN